MHIIGRISEGSLIYLTIMQMSFAPIGKEALSSVGTKKDAFSKQLVSTLMDGKNKNTTLSTSKLNNVKTKNVTKPTNAHFTILKENKE
jgi:hypothetical protein